jgi:hypothetical protein
MRTNRPSFTTAIRPSRRHLRTAETVQPQLAAAWLNVANFCAIASPFLAAAIARNFTPKAHGEH